MRHIYFYTLLAFLAGSCLATPAMAAKIKHRSTIYNAGAETSLRFPEGVGCSQNSFVVADTGNRQLVRYSLTAQLINPEAVFPLPETSPIVVQIADDRTIFVLDGKSRTILKVTEQGQVAGKVEPRGIPAPQRVVPRSFKFGQDGNLYILDIFGERVLVLASDVSFVRVLPFPEEYGFFSDLAIGPQGTVYLLDSVSGEIYASQSGAESFELFSSGLEEFMNFPVSLALDSTGVIYVTDQYGSGLAQIGRDGSFQGRKFGMGWEDGQFYYPSQVCIDAQGNLIVADRSNSRVQVFQILSD